MLNETFSEIFKHRGQVAWYQSQEKQDLERERRFPTNVY